MELEETTPEVKVKGKGGRPRDPNKKHFRTVGLTETDWRYMTLYAQGEVSQDCWQEFNPTPAFEDAVERLRKMSPGGPNVGPQSVSRPRHRAPQRVNVYAQRRGLTRSEALALIAQRYLAEHPEEFE